LSSESGGLEAEVLMVDASSMIHVDMCRKMVTPVYMTMRQSDFVENIGITKSGKNIASIK
jgi:hypothetical protein